MTDPEVNILSSVYKITHICTNPVIWYTCLCLLWYEKYKAFQLRVGKIELHLSDLHKHIPTLLYRFRGGQCSYYCVFYFVFTSFEMKSHLAKIVRARTWRLSHRSD